MPEALTPEQAFELDEWLQREERKADRLRRFIEVMQEIDRDFASVECIEKDIG